MTLLDPGLFRHPHFRLGDLRADAAEHHAGWSDDRPSDLPADQARVQRDADRAVPRPTLTDDVRDGDLGGKTKRAPALGERHRLGFGLTTVGIALLIPIVPSADSGWALLGPLAVTGAGLGLLVSQLNNYTLAPIDDERISEAAGVNSAAGSFGLSFGLAMAGGVLLATLSVAFTTMVNDSAVIPASQQQQISKTLENNAEVMSTTHLSKLVADEPPAVQDEILKINTDSTNLALQLALLIPILAGGLGLVNSFRMLRLPDIAPSAAAEAAALG